METQEQIVRDFIDRWNKVAGMNKITIQEGVYNNSYDVNSYYLWINYQSLYIYRQEVDLKFHTEEEAKNILYGRFLETTFLYGLGARFQSSVDLSASDKGTLEYLN